MDAHADVDADALGNTEQLQRTAWVPLESNPEMLSKFAYRVGLPAGWGFVDVYGIDSELLTLVPQPCVAVTLLYQWEPLEGFKEAQREQIEKEGQEVSSELFYMRQYVGGACGTIAAIHSIANNEQVLKLPGDSSLGQFLSNMKGGSPEDLGLALASASELHGASEASAVDGQTATSNRGVKTGHHFVTFVEKGGDVYELDGRKAFPINHGPSKGDLLRAATTVIQEKFMTQNPSSIHFSMMALVRF